MKLQKSGSTDLIKRLGKILSVAALFAGAAILFFGCDEEVQKIKPFASPAELPLVYDTNFTTTYIDSFKVQFYMKAPVVQKFKTEGQQYLEFPRGILMVRYGPDGKVISRITADYAKEYEKDQRWEAKNNVVAVNENGDTLKTEYLVWEEKSGKIYSDKFVRIIRPDQIFTGIGFEADQNLQNWKIKDPKGSMYISVKKGESTPGGKQMKAAKKDSLKPVRLTN